MPRSRRARSASPPPRAKATRRRHGALPERDLGFYTFRLSDVMTRKVAVARVTDSLEATASVMSRRRVSGVPVVDGQRRVVGVLSQKDIVRLLHDRHGLSLPGGVFDLVLDVGRAGRADLPAKCLATLKATTVGDAMSRSPVTLTPTARIDEAIRLMIERGFNRLPVVRNGKLVGIVTRTDLLTGSARPA